MARQTAQAMSFPHARLTGPSVGVHPVVLGRKLQDLALLGVAALIPLVLALAVVIAMPKPNVPLVFGGLLGALGIVALVASPRLEVTVAVIAVYLGCLNGPLKLVVSAGAASSALQDIVVLAVALGVLLRVIVRRQGVRLPALSGWVIAFTLIVLTEAFNPKTQGLLKVGGGYRQQLQWVPFFFFGYLLMRTPDRFRKAFMLLGVIAVINGAVATAQTQLSPNQVASFGAGYEQRIKGPGGRTYASEGESHVRPLALGADSGFGGGVAVIALPGSLALLSTLRRRRWIGLVLSLGCLVAAITSLGRLQLGGAVLDIGAFALLSISAGRRLSRPLATLLVLAAVAIPLGAVFVSAVGSGVFSRYQSLAPEKAASEATGYKQGVLSQIPHQLAAAPFGFGLGTAGAVSGFGGKQNELLEGHNVTAETQANFLVKELGLLGLLVWYGFLLRLIVLAFRRVREARDPDLQAYLAAMFAPLLAILFMSYDGPVSSSAALGPYFWFAAGVAGYWLAGPGRALMRSALGHAAPAPAPAPGSLAGASG
jgi:hypothetical protein